MTSTLLTSESMMMDVFGELSIVMALPFPLTRIVVFLHLVINIEWLISAVISIGEELSSKFSYILN